MIQIHDLEAFLEEQERVSIARFKNETVDYSKLRALARRVNGSMENFNTEGTDEELWQSIVDFLRSLLK